MKTRLTLVCVVLIVLAATVNGQTVPAPEWKRYTVKGEEFSVLLPHLPSMTSTEMSVPRLKDGQAVMKKRRERVLVAAADGITYTIYAYENPEPRQTLDEFINEQTKRSMFVTAAPGTQKFFAGENHLYLFVANGAPAEHAKVTQFFSSIVLGKKREGIKVSDGPGIPLEPLSVEHAYVGREVDTKARMTNRPEPVYTAAARKHEVTGVVVLKVVFASTGVVTNIRVVQGLPDGLTERAIEAAKKIKFVPATKDGKNVSMWIQLEYNFNLY